MLEVDTCGFSCPQPVLMFHQAIQKDNPTSLVVIVDNQASLENVSRAAAKKGYQVTATKVDSSVTRLEMHK